MSTARSHHTASALIDGTVLVAGRTTYGEVYDPSTGIWKNTTGVITLRYLHTASTLANGAILVAGGNYGGYALGSTEIYG
ncbi:unnamed protein product [Rotaria socialis]|nr:unnamed protein product [Rotaria socialis]